MKAIVVQEGGRLSIVETNGPIVAREQIKIRVHACGVNRADIMQRKGFYPAPKGTRNDILGLEFAGVVEACGEKTSMWKVGDRVMGIVSGEAYAEYVVLHERLLLPIPKGLSMEEAACIPEAFCTAYDGLFQQLQLQTGDRVLIHAIGSGVGDAAYQLAKHRGIHIVGTTRSAWKRERYPDLETGIVVHDGDFISQLAGKVDGIIDFVGRGYLKQNIKALRPQGTLLILGLLGGVQDECPLGLLLVKRLKIMGSTLRSRPFEEKLLLMTEFQKRALPLFEQSILRVTLDSIFSWEEVEKAHTYMQENANVGKVVLKIKA